MNPVATILARHDLMILDGAFATELEQRGCNLNDPLWSAKILLEQPQQISAVHLDYFKAGADCAITASYQATFAGFRARGLSDEDAIRLMQLSVSLAKDARDEFWSATDQDQTRRPRPLVAASVGPYGAYLADGSEYRGDYGLSEEDLITFHRRRMATLIDAGPDLLACETIPCLSEAMALAKLLREFPVTSAWLSFSARDGLHTRNGERLRDCAECLDAYDQICAIGLNCTEPRYISSLIREIRQATEKPIIVYPNSGEEYDPVRKTWLPAAPTDFAALAKQWYADGARIIGGCCRTGPAEIRALQQTFRGGC